jgi:glycosyltransferase involved in cell wall biosynthesis
MEVLQLLDSRALGGIESHVLTLAGGLRRRGVDARVAFFKDHGHHPLHAALAEDAIPWTALNGTRGLLRTLRETPPDLLHTHGYKAGILGRILARSFGVPVISSFHAGEPGNGRMRLYNGFDRLTARLAPRIAVSAKIAATLPGPVALVPNFVRCPSVVATRPDRRPVIGFVGRLSHEKGPDLFLAIAERLQDRCDFVIFGDGPMRAGLTEHPAARGVTFRGFVPSMTPHWAEVDLLCLSSRFEGLPMAVLEAMAHGCPVAGFSVGAMADVISHGHTGYLAPPLDLAALEAGISEWISLSAPERAALGRTAIEAVRSRYGLDTGLDRMMALYSEAVAKGSNNTQHQSSGV